MKPYGLPRNKDIEFPDVVDIRVYGLSSKYSTGLDGRFHGIRRTKNKRRIRTSWKKKYRMKVSEMLRKEFNDYVRYVRKETK